ncbi:MAG: 4a-hydroxytetrahydrobiopterin dehydratase [Rubrivivax sp.]
MNHLQQQRCRSMIGQAAMTPAEVTAHLPEVPQWAVVDGALERTFGFTDFHRTMAFVNAVAWIAQQENHGPDLFVNWTSCRVRFNTHDVQGLSLNDFICAAKVDALIA